MWVLAGESLRDPGAIELRSEMLQIFFCEEQIRQGEEVLQALKGSGIRRRGSSSDGSMMGCVTSDHVTFLVVTFPIYNTWGWGSGISDTFASDWGQVHDDQKGKKRCPRKHVPHLWTPEPQTIYLGTVRAQLGLLNEVALWVTR